MPEVSTERNYDHTVAGFSEVAGKTTIMFGNLDSRGALVVQAYEDTSWVLSRDEIAEKIREYSNGNLPTEPQEQPFWTYVDSRHRLVFRLEIPSWYFPDLNDMQQGKMPFKLVSEDPQDDYKRPQIMSERNIWPKEQEGNKNIKTIYVDYVGGWQTIPFVFDLNVNIWQDEEGRFKTPIIIDPGSEGGRGVP